MSRTPLTQEQIATRLPTLNGWTADNNVLSKTFQMETYLAGPAFAAAVGTVCEGLDHHPDIHIGWRRVTVSFTTHDSGNVLTEFDFKAAQAVDALGYPKA
ncbi:MAG: 4a-hydroxytetrahydrobiopterin dehydratase [Chloroflexota bacterium]|nr:4a-hydroxytetrahydrobiopterin dehydratase [Chloroflexota bacterium]